MDVCQKISDNLSLLTSEKAKEVNVSSRSPMPFLGEATSSKFQLSIQWRTHKTQNERKAINKLTHAL